MLRHEYHTGKNGESPSASQIERDPEAIPDVDIAARLSVGRDILLDKKLPRHESGQGYVRVVEQSIRWKEMEASTVFTYQGLTACTNVDTLDDYEQCIQSHETQERGD